MLQMTGKERTMRRKACLVATLAVALAAPFAIAAAEEMEKPAGAIVAASAAIATVQEIDYETRVVTLRDSEGSLTTFTAGKSVRNLAQVEKGDVVLMEYFQGFAMALGPKGSGLEARRDELEVKAAKPGEKPAGTVTETIDVIAVVKDVDRENRVVTLQGAQATVVLGVADDVDLNAVKVRDEVQARYVSLFAIAVVPAPKVSATVEVESTTVAIGVGITWGNGSMVMYDGSTHEFKVGGLSLLDLGISKVGLSGEVYRLTDPRDFAGTYVAGAAGAALGKGASTVVLKNRKGVVMRLKAKQEGARLTLASAGVKIDLVE
jgi:Cu/Ag efflux protein CusF